MDGLELYDNYRSRITLCNTTERLIVGIEDGTNESYGYLTRSQAIQMRDWLSGLIEENILEDVVLTDDEFNDIPF